LKSVLSDPSYLETTYSEEMAPAGDYPSKLARHLQEHFFGMPGKLLDAGSGRGDFLRAFAALGFEVRGMDISEKAVELGRGFEVKVADIETDAMPFPSESFDYVFSKSLIEHLRDPASLLRKCAESLKPGGILVVMTPSWVHNRWGPFYCDHTHVTPFTALSLSSAMRMCGFEDVGVNYFRQLPFLWKMPFLLPAVKLIEILPVPYRPFHTRSPRWPGGLNKLIRFSKEVMLLGVGRKRGGGDKSDG
jgi:SAM-dependent methyltransferase